MTTTKPLTDRSYWDETWESVVVPAPIDVSDRSLRNHATLEFHRFFSGVLNDKSPAAESLIEIGCAQSKWLPYFAKVHGLKVAGVDFSELGCVRARDLLARAGCDGEVLQADMFEPPETMRGRFDVVLSMGLVEHFPDTASAVRACAGFARPGGLVLTTIPNMTGLTGLGQRWLDRGVYEKHVPLNREALAAAHRDAGLTVLRSNYLMSANLAVINHPNLKPRILDRLVRASLVSATGLIWALERGGLRIPPAQWLSPYVACVARKPV